MTVVRVEQGDARGTERDGVRRFLGLPYAEPPVGDLRWRPPRPPAPWTGVRDASTFGNAAIQTVNTGLDLRAPQSEDCLYLNVWTPATAGPQPRPVMVWIHGGGFINGAASFAGYDGESLARTGVTVVSLNYRLGAFGFLTHPDFGANFAVQDWIAGLEWVAANISAFGGDPERVTVFGQSAGAAAVRGLLSAPAAHGLFHRAVIQSAGFEDYAVVASPSYDRAALASEQLLDRIGAVSPREARGASAEAIREASLALSGIFPPAGQVHTPANLTWYPVPDGHIVAEEGFPGWREGVPVMLGCVENESRFFIRPSRLYAHDDQDPAEVYTSATLENMAAALSGGSSEEVLRHYEDTPLSPYEALDELYSAAIWFEPALASAERFADLGREVYLYHFARVSPGAAASGERAMHAVELPYLFGVLDPGAHDATDTVVSAEVQHAWTEFARTGTPASVGGRPWPRFERADPRHAVIGDTPAFAPSAPRRVVELIRAQRAGQPAPAGA